MKLVPFLFTYFQAILATTFFSRLLLAKVFPHPKPKYFKYTNKDWLIGGYSVSILILSYLILEKLDELKGLPNYGYSCIIILLTIVIILLYFTYLNFLRKEPIKKKIKIDRRIKTKFEIKRVSEKELQTLFRDNLKNSFLNEYLDFKTLLIDRNKPESKINCVEKVRRNKQIAYTPIFEFINAMSTNGILDLWDVERKKLYSFIKENFTRGTEPIKQKSLEKAFNTWLKANK